jgi:1-acyl-sn-glycerol-3-phosphate acyltransferase
VISKQRRLLLGNPVSLTVLSVWSWLVLGVLVLAWVPLMGVVWLVTARRDPGRYRVGFLFRKLAVVHQRLNPLWRFRITGHRVDDPRRPYVVVANHESFVDILLLSHLPWEMKWLSKADFFRYPVVGWLMRMAADVRLERGDPRSMLGAMKECRRRLDANVSVMIFPEGTRTDDGELGEFLDGAFRLAIQAGAPVLPIAVRGTRTAMRKGDWRNDLSDAEARVLEPIETVGLTRRDAGALNQQVRDRIAAALATMG